MSLASAAYHRAGKAIAAAESRRPFGRSVYSTDWDICLVLDSTRLDMLREAWQRAGGVDAVWSRGSITTEWLCNTFRDEHAASIAETAFVSATPHSETVFGRREWLTNAAEVPVEYPDPPVVDPAAFDGFYEVWRSHATAEGAVPPGTMLDATLEAAESHSRVVAHWMQPHEPFIAPGAEVVGGGPTETNVWDGLNRRDLDPDPVWQSYMANLKYALFYVETLLENVDARMLITSDHGNAFGEWGLYGHPFAFPQPAVRRVPWIETQARDRGTYDRLTAPLSTAESADTPLETQLRALGYR
jgi:hypothetical protein